MRILKFNVEGQTLSKDPVNTGAVQSRTANDSKYVSLDGFWFDIE